MFSLFRDKLSKVCNKKSFIFHVFIRSIDMISTLINATFEYLINKNNVGKCGITKISIVSKLSIGRETKH